MSALLGFRVLMVVTDDPAARHTVEVARLLGSAGAVVGLQVAPGAERWFGAASLAHLAVADRLDVSMVGLDWSPDAALVLGGEAARAAWAASTPGLPLLAPCSRRDEASTDWVLPTARRALAGAPLAGRKVVVTAGPTVEHFDAVRFLSNPSSGKMGYAVAAAAWQAGAEVTLISGPTSLDAPYGVRRVAVGSAREMRDAVLAGTADVVFKAAAVSDYRPAVRLAGKVKKTAGPWTLEMERTSDILTELALSPMRPSLLIGFAAETDDIERYAREKLHAKSLDGIVANDVGAGGAFGSDSNRVECYDAAGSAVVFGPAAKQEVAASIVAWAAALLARKQ